MSVLRKRLDSSFTVVPNDLLEDETLDLAAKGLVCYMLAKPDGWSFSADRMARQLPEGREAIRNALNRAEVAGWVQRRDERHPDGTFSRIVMVRNNRLLPWETGGPTDDGQTDLGLTDLGSTVAVSKDSVVNTELARTEVTLAPRKRDAIWDVLVAAYGKPTDTGHKAMNAAAKTLRDYGAQPEDIAWTIRTLGGTDLNWAVTTPSALAKHYGERDALIAQLDRPRVYDHAAAIMRGATQ